MWRDTPFKICFILSTFIHITILYPWHFLQFTSRPEITFQRLELTYFKVGETEDVLIKEMKPVTSLERKSGTKKVISKKMEINLKKGEESKIKQKREITRDTESETFRDSLQKVEGRESTSKDEMALENYCLKVREKLKSTLKKNRTDFVKNKKGFVKEGDVYVVFIIDREGILKDLYLYRSSGKDVRQLEKIVLESVKEAAPFPPFSPEIKKKELLLRVPIHFDSMKK